MDTIVLYDEGGHKNVLLPDYDTGLGIQANQHLIMHGGKGMILDPGGHKVYSKVLGDTLSLLGGGQLRYIFLSHQDPDIVAAINGWLMSTDADALAPNLWLRFIPHFGVDSLVASRMHGIPDEGQWVDLGGVKLGILPAHFLHSCGNYQVYDPTSKILYSGDLGASVGGTEREVTDFQAHIGFMEGFHKRYMTSRTMMAAWATMVRQLDIDIIAPQHGALMRGPHVKSFIDWCESFPCGVDTWASRLLIPEGGP